MDVKRTKTQRFKHNIKFDCFDSMLCVNPYARLLNSTEDKCSKYNYLTSLQRWN